MLDGASGIKDQVMFYGGVGFAVFRMVTLEIPHMEC